MSVAINRMQFLRGDFRGTRAAVRPPWALAETLFVERCSQCADCVTACPQAILVTGSGGYPEVDFQKGECTFCGDCLRVCNDGALDAQLSPPWSLTAVIGDRCLPRRGVECRSCADQCPEVAIRFQLRVGGPAFPQLDAPTCTGCGACVGTCPAGAIQVSRQASTGGQ